MNEAGNEVSLVFIELGLAVIGLALLARLASRWGFSAIPLYLVAGLSFGTGGLLPLNFKFTYRRAGYCICLVYGRVGSYPDTDHTW